MTITREQVADLRAGDVVELRLRGGTIIRGPLTESTIVGGLGIAGAGWDVCKADGSPAPHISDGANDLTVISRRLYVNHDRTEPVVGDVVRDAADDSTTETWVCRDIDSTPWQSTDCQASDDWYSRDQLPDRLLLLVDGETGKAVPS